MMVWNEHDHPRNQRNGRFTDKTGSQTDQDLTVANPMTGLATRDVDDATQRLKAAVRNEHLHEGDHYWTTPWGRVSDHTLHRILPTQLERDRYLAWTNGTPSDRRELAAHWGDPRYAADKIEEIDMRGHAPQMDFTDQWDDRIQTEQDALTALTAGPQASQITPEYADAMHDAYTHFDLERVNRLTDDPRLTGRDVAWTIRHYPTAIDTIATGRHAHRLSKRDADWTLNHLNNPERSRHHAIMSLNLSNDMKDRLLHSTDPHDRAALATRPDLTLEQRQTLARDPDPHVRAETIPWLSHSELQEAAMDPSDVVRSRVASDQAATPLMLNRLAHDPSPMVRRVTAGNPNTPTDTLTQLAHDPDPRVVRNVAMNPDTPAGTLRQLTRHEDNAISTPATISLEAQESNSTYTDVMLHGQWRHNDKENHR